MVKKFVIANNVKQSMYLDNMDCHGLRPRSDGGKLAITSQA